HLHPALGHRHARRGVVDDRRSAASSPIHNLLLLLENTGLQGIPRKKNIFLQNHAPCSPFSLRWICGKVPMIGFAVRSVAVSAVAVGAMVLALPATAQSRVGVTSATTGDPLGKPPAQAERVLKVGIDVQANEAITTGANDRAHLLFLDG